MALTTRCPQCGTSFKVVPDQLRVRNGLVRCGACSTVFDGRACLVSAPGAPVVATAPASAPLPSSAAAVAAPVLAAPEPHPPAAPIPEPAYAPPAIPVRAPAVAPPQPPAPVVAPVAPPKPPQPQEPRIVLPWEDEPEAPPAPMVRSAPTIPSAPAVPPAVLRGRDDIRKRTEPQAAAADDDIEDDDYVDDDGEPFLRAPEPPRAAPSHQAPAYRQEPIVARRSDEPTLDWRSGRARTGERDNPYNDPRENLRDDQHDDQHDDTYADAYDDVRDLERDDEYDHDDDRDADAHEPVLGDTRTRYSSATDVGRAPPEFLDQDRIERSGLVRKLWGYACLVGLIALALQLLYAYRTDIANSVPALRPVLETVCKPLDCTVGYARRRDLISISSSSLQPPTGAAAIDDGRTRLVLTVMLHNRYDKPQYWPALVLELNDLSDTVVVRKVLMPEDYLTPQQLAGPFGPQGALKISVPIEVTGVQVNGYQLDKFFP
ncbi:MAG: DUF3426 domain-containing protein [Achromobacter mucicolens]|uniref:DUF3426 domain-containing protein n=2 Tax=Achromobacter mucicolens TaxID=1389922 RepID=UPI003D0969D8